MSFFSSIKCISLFYEIQLCNCISKLALDGSYSQGFCGCGFCVFVCVVERGSAAGCTFLTSLTSNFKFSSDETNTCVVFTDKHNLKL